MQDFRQLRIWQRSNKLAPRIRKLTATFPKGYTKMKHQIHSAIESVAFNIAEGCGANSNKEFGRFLDIAVKSATELEAQLILAIGYGIADPPLTKKLADEAVQIRRMTRTLRKKLAP